MLKRGFTLAEVLITLMIIGVVATLTTPALVKNVGSSKIGPQLAKFVNTWETAVETMMMEENVSSISALMSDATFAGSSEFMDKIARHMIVTNLKDVKNPTSIQLSDSSGKALDTISFSTGNVWQLKDGTIIDIGQNDIEYSYNEKGAYKGSICFITVDIGGLKGSHRLGKEVFGFVLDDSGVLIPYGSNAHKSLSSSSVSASCNTSSTSKASLYACTGAVADNGYKAPW